MQWYKGKGKKKKSKKREVLLKVLIMTQGNTAIDPPPSPQQKKVKPTIYWFIMKPAEQATCLISYDEEK